VSEGFAPSFHTEQIKDVCEQKLQEQFFSSALGQSRTDSEVPKNE